MKPEQILLDILQEVQRDVKVIRETQLEQGFDIKSNKENLVEHMRRTELLETRVDKLEEIKKLRKYSWKLICGICGGLATFAGFIYTIFRFHNELLK